MRDECIGIPPRFECELCPSKFRRKYHLVRHLSARHNLTVPNVDIKSSSVLPAQSSKSLTTTILPVVATEIPATTIDLSMRKENTDLSPLSATSSSAMSANNVMNNFSVDAIMMKNEHYDAVMSSSKFKFWEDLRLKLGLTFTSDSILKDHQIKY